MKHKNMINLILSVAFFAAPHVAAAFGSVGMTSLSSRASTFHTTSSLTVKNSRAIPRSTLFSRLKTKFDEAELQNEVIASFDPLGCSDTWDVTLSDPNQDVKSKRANTDFRRFAPLSIAALAIPSTALATDLSTGLYNPDSFKPVCSASDSFYRFLQGSTRAVVGDENFSEYGPLIAGGLLRIRLELCVVESFFNEAVGPFIEANGLSWILPLHETVETFLAGTIFALATTFILVGSTKLIQIIAFYGDLVVGGPCRLFGGFFFDRARGEPVTLDVSFFGFFKTRLVGPPVDFKEEELKNKIRGVDEKSLVEFDKIKPTDIPLLAVSGAVKVVGEASKLFREFIEALDLFVGRYLVLLASGYIIVKFVHFKIFPDFP